jgi:DNA mismatch repair protein MutS
MAEVTTPMMQQYLELKRQNPDCLLFFRLGDFYELFFEDAELVSRELELTLTGRACGGKERAPMCGVPYHSVNTYIGRLIEKGYRVAIAEQLTDPALSKGLVERNIVRIVTPGTVLEDNLLNSDQNNYVACVRTQNNEVGLAYADISTGEFDVFVCDDSDQTGQVLQELLRVGPSEIIADDASMALFDDDFRQRCSVVPRVFHTQICGSYLSCMKMLSQKFGFEQTDTQTQKMTQAGAGVAAMLLEYLTQTQRGVLEQMRTLTLQYANTYMRLDPGVIETLELLKSLHGGQKRRSLLGILDCTHTSMGARMLRKWVERPLNNALQINSRLDAVEALFGDNALRDDIGTALRDVYDLERLCARISGTAASPRDLLSLGTSLTQMPVLRSLLEGHTVALLQRIYRDIDPLDDVCALISGAISADAPTGAHDAGVIADGFDAQLDELRDAQKNGHAWLAKLEATEREQTGIKNLKIGYNRVFGYYFEVTKSYYDLVPLRYTRKQTLANSERFITEELHEIEQKITAAQEQIAQREYTLFKQVQEVACRALARIQKTAAAVAALDACTALAQVAQQHGYVRPQIDDDGVIDIQDGRHPIVEAIKRDIPFVPNDALLDTQENRFLMITGPNMAGKSTYLRQVALIVLMAHMGSFVPARNARIGLVDNVFTRIGASDDLSGGQSTFMLEMNEVAHILQAATPKSLLVLDEVGRGTSTFDGLSIAWAITEYISQQPQLRAKTMFATHYHELTQLEGNLDGIKNYCVSVKERGRDVFFLRKIVRGSADKSFGIHVARLAALPEPLLTRAAKILHYLEQSELNKQTKKIIDGSAKDTARAQQIGMFADDTASVQVLRELRDLEVSRLTPLEALNALDALQKKLLHHGGDV